MLDLELGMHTERRNTTKHYAESSWLQTEQTRSSLNATLDEVPAWIITRMVCKLLARKPAWAHEDIVSEYT